jgi:hypothetical protein
MSFHCALHFHPISLPLFDRSFSVYWREKITERFIKQLSTPSCTSELSPRHIIFKHNQSLANSILRSRTEMKESDASPFESDRPIPHTLASRLCCVENSMWNLVVHLFLYSFIHSFSNVLTFRSQCHVGLFHGYFTFNFTFTFSVSRSSGDIAGRVYWYRGSSEKCSVVVSAFMNILCYICSSDTTILIKKDRFS